MDFELYIKHAYTNAVDHGFWDVDKITGKVPGGIEEKLGLVISELGEAMEANRKGRRSAVKLEDIECADDFNTAFKENVKDSLEDELADTCIRIFDLCGKYNVELAVVPVKLNGSDCSEHIFGIMKSVAIAELNLQNMLCQAVSMIFMLSEKYNIDIKKHIDMKMRYNESRGYKHGKSY
jgi:NTP pyrophosphatase (non-canonical NTP hydrolase)